MRDSFRREYLGTWSELPEDPPHKQAYVPMCRHCKNDRAHHEQDHCLFDSTTWEPMSEEEYGVWRMSVMPKYLGTVTGRTSSNPPYIKKGGK